ncbi:MAG: type II toxin-antitoxin system PemK/MazF family toxin [Deltaproteobacteria bacterium]|nr:type II toxin-antitoxin system PemK/MazF family toxin [Deltaproteobacteria bacterium]
MKGLTPRRGEVWLVNFNPGRGSEQKGVRPGLVIQNDTGNIYASTTIVAAITSTIKEFPVTVVLSEGEGGLKQRSMVNLAQLLTIDKGRLQRRLGQLGDAVMEKVSEAVRVSLDV